MSVFSSDCPVALVPEEENYGYVKWSDGGRLVEERKVKKWN